jgi:tRNA threonylcarbamoyl adenosine modification protein (Sua5/YciO/YrdC/YwlC family)
VIDQAVDAIQRGKSVILPTDTVYGLATTALHADAVLNLYRLKGRPVTQPTALLAPDLEMLFELVPELRGRAGVIARALLPGPYTLVLPNPARRYRWLTGESYDGIGVRVPELPEPTAELLGRVSALAATSANRPGDPDPARLDDVPEEMKTAAAVVVNGRELPGVPSTVLDFTGAVPRVLREGAASGAEAIEKALEATARF